MTFFIAWIISMLRPYLTRTFVLLTNGDSIPPLAEMLSTVMNLKAGVSRMPALATEVYPPSLDSSSSG